MTAILAGSMLWLFVVIAYVAGVDLGSTATIVLLSLGAIFIAISFIDTIKMSASGFEIKTREQKQALNLNISIPKTDYIKILCWIILISFLILAIYATILPSPEKIRHFDQYSNYSWIDDPNDLSTRVRTLLVWNGFFGLISVAVLFVKRFNKR